MSTLDDLLIQRRRAPLSDADERRVQIAVASSRDHQLALLAGEAFDRAGAAQPGDAELVRKIVRQVEGEWSGTFQRQSPARPRWSRWAAVPALIAGVAAASWGGERLLQSMRDPDNHRARSHQQDAHRQDAHRAVPVARLGAPASAPPLAEAPVRGAAQAPLAESPSAVPPGEGARLDPAKPADGAAATQRGPSTSRGPVSRSPAPVLLRPAAPRPAPDVAAAGLAPGTDETARTLFLRANRLRRDDWTAAAALYEQLTRRFAQTTEAGVAEMALGKHALDEGHPNQALSWFRAYQRRADGELASEALWGEARALESLGEATAARAVWRRLLNEYPGSAYAAVARQQLGS